MLKKPMIAVLVLLVCGMVMGAASSGPPLLCDEPGNVVDSGVVIAYGERIAPPFHIWMDADHLVLNGFVFAPRPVDPRLAAREISISPAQLKRHELIEAISETYVNVYSSGGKQAAQAEVIETFGVHEFILSMRFEEEFLVVEFADSHVEWTDMRSHVEAARNREMVHREIVQARAVLAGDLTEMLQAGKAIVFGYDYTIYISVEVFEELEGIVDAVVRGEVDEEIAETWWVNLLGNLSRSFFADVMTHLDSWGRD